MKSTPIHRRAAIGRLAAIGLAAPSATRLLADGPRETLRHASFGASGMALSDIRSLSASPHLTLVAVAEVDERRVGELKTLFPKVKVYRDWRDLLAKEKELDSVNVSTPDHMHAPIALAAIRRGLHVYGQKPLARTVAEARVVAEAATKAKVVTQMGIQIHSHEHHKAVVATIESGVIGRVGEVHSWCGKGWGDPAPRPRRSDPVPAGFDWDLWLGVAGERSYVEGYDHPAEWRKRLDFGTGTFGDMGCHILDPVFASLGLGAPTVVRSDGAAPNADNWALGSEVRYAFPATARTTDAFSLTWYDTGRRPPAAIQGLLGGLPLPRNGTIYLGTDGVLLSPYIGPPVLLPASRFVETPLSRPSGDDHYLQFVEAALGHGRASTPFSYAGPLTEAVLLGCLATRFPGVGLAWDSAALRFTNSPEANAFVRPRYRKGWEVEGI